MTPTTVLICDDSRTYATALQMLLEQDGGVRVVGISPSGEHAVEAVRRLHPALVTMDLELPGMDGVEAIERIMRRHPVPVVVLSSHAQNGSRKAAAALAAGAVDAIPKSDVRLGDPRGTDALRLRRRIRQLAEARVAPPPAGSSKPPSSPKFTSRKAVAVGIGASTGGPRALRSVLSGLPGDYPLPLLVVQHIGGEFLDGLARWLDEEITLPVRIAGAERVAGPGVWLAPAGTHLTVSRSLQLVLDPDAGSGPHCPSVDALLESMASAFGADAVGVVLTGMGSDGSRGVAAVTAAGGLAIAQDEASSVVYGMPRAAVKHGAATFGIEAIAPALRALRPVGAHG
jgi:two-component system chemotaxis response regulator CheB